MTVWHRWNYNTHKHSNYGANWRTSLFLSNLSSLTFTSPVSHLLLLHLHLSTIRNGWSCYIFFPSSSSSDSFSLWMIHVLVLHSSPPVHSSPKLPNTRTLTFWNFFLNPVSAQWNTQTMTGLLRVSFTLVLKSGFYTYTHARTQQNQKYDYKISLTTFLH